MIITSDHGEEFGERGLFDHGTSLYLREVRVPLLVIGPKVPAGLAVSEPVSLRDLPATIVDQLGLSAGSPFPAARSPSTGCRRPGRRLPVPRLPCRRAPSPSSTTPGEVQALPRRGYTLSLVAKGRHYVRDGGGNEELYELADDLTESNNLKGIGEAIAAARLWLLKALPTGPAVGYPGLYGRLLEAQVAGRLPGGGCSVCRRASVPPAQQQKARSATTDCRRCRPGKVSASLSSGDTTSVRHNIHNYLSQANRLPADSPLDRRQADAADLRDALPVSPGMGHVG